MADTEAQRKTIANIVVSMDGFTSDRDGGNSWLIDYAVQEQTSASFEGVWRGASTALLGRTNYEGFRGFWPSVVHNPDASPRDRDFASWLDSVEKVVFSRTLTETDWNNARVASDLEAEVRALRAAPGRDILVLSSVSVIGSLLAADLLDELRMAVLPTVLGGGLRLFPEGVPVSAWELAGTSTLPAGAVGLHYRRNRSA